ncbi:TMEM165/GDT1 family protein [Novosphingobium sp. FSY-8]|uniref:GDT1 family protein n=1 Tax=Novosphingobium ovatum TaxID=1908523 RepID=A0ABW9XB75_9SPHN|nr:TMEM165/GDT1 family protein [Novosphingobium ovatum]NBC35779.1 TMEM165/GDT1 family protein [Novosphingobium ovatum]
MTPLLSSTAVVTLAEIGDKTMLLAIILAARLRRPWAIVAGIFAATVVNHLISAFIGAQVAGLLEALWFRVAVAIGFLAMAAWTLVPDKLDEDEAAQAVKGKGGKGAMGAFLTTLVSFFLVEIGDKTQIATIALGAQFPAQVFAVAAGTTLGMMIADAPAVFLGDKLVRIVPLSVARIVAAGLFAVIGLWQLAVTLGWI